MLKKYFQVTVYKFIQAGKTGLIHHSKDETKFDYVILYPKSKRIVLKLVPMVVLLKAGLSAIFGKQLVRITSNKKFSFYV